MKVLHVNNVYNFGSTGKITRDIHLGLLEKGVDSVVYYGRREKANEKNVHKFCGEIYAKANNVISRFTGLPYGGNFFSTKKLIRAIKKEKPDIVHLQCLNGFFVNIYKLIAFLKNEHIVTVLTLHAEFMYTANCGHAFACEKWKYGCGKCENLRAATGSLFFDRTAFSNGKMREAFSGFKELIVVGVSEWITERARQSKMFEDAAKIMCIPNGINLENFDCHVHKEDDAVAEKYGISKDRPIILHVTSSLTSQFKGGNFFLELAAKAGDEYQCVIVGSDSVECNTDIKYIPFTNNQSELASLYRLAAVKVISSTAENYPTVCLEAQSCGTPVVGFDVGGVAETIFPGMGECVPVGDVDLLLEKAKFWAGMKYNISREALKNCQKKNSEQRMIADYFTLYTRALESMHDDMLIEAMT